MAARLRRLPPLPFAHVAGRAAAGQCSGSVPLYAAASVALAAELPRAADRGVVAAGHLPWYWLCQAAIDDDDLCRGAARRALCHVPARGQGPYLRHTRA